MPFDSSTPRQGRLICSGQHDIHRETLSPKRKKSSQFWLELSESTGAAELEATFFVDL